MSVENKKTALLLARTKTFKASVVPIVVAIIAIFWSEESGNAFRVFIDQHMDKIILISLGSIGLFQRLATLKNGGK